MEENQLELTKPCTIPPHETPSHRLAEHSARYLSDTELLSLILKGSIGTERSLDASRRLLAACGSLRKLAALSLRELQKFAGIGTVGACAIHAAMELTVRIQRATDTANRIVLTSPHRTVHMSGRCPLAVISGRCPAPRQRDRSLWNPDAVKGCHSPTRSAIRCSGSAGACESVNNTLGGPEGRVPPAGLPACASCLRRKWAGTLHADRGSAQDKQP